MLAARLPPLAHFAIAASSPVSRETILDALVAPTLVLAHYLQAGSAAAEVLALAQEGGASLPLALYEVGYVLPNCRVEDLGVELPHEAVFAAQEGWAKCVEQGGEEVVMSAIARLQEGVVGVEGRAR